MTGNNDYPDRAPLIGIERHRLATDGQGVTTLVAFHGCPLSCRYCLNPQCHAPEAVWRCVSPEELHAELRVDGLYFLATGGGVTFGGGEPCLRSDFIVRFRALCDSQWRITVETSLNVPRGHLQMLLPVVDEYIVDIKDMNPEIYRRYTGRSNLQVIRNLRWMAERMDQSRLLIRVPHIPDYNTHDDVRRSVAALSEMGFTRFDVMNYKKQ